MQSDTTKAGWPKRKLALAMAGLMLAGLASAPPSAGAAGESKQDVRVVNAVTEPVPTQVQGSVALADGTAVGASQSGPWSVAVGNLPPVKLDPAANGVQILNSPSSPVHVVTTDRKQHFQRHFIMSVNGGQRCEMAGIPLVPDGTRLVITSFNARMYPITGVAVRTFVQARRADHSFANIYVPYEKQDFHDDQNDRDEYVGVIETTLVHENSFPFFVTICMSKAAPGESTSSLGVFQGTLLGYTEPIAG